MLKLLILTTLLVVISGSSLAQDMQGTDSQGNPVILRADGTWSYIGNQPKECQEYANTAVSQQKLNLAWQCGYTDVLWHDSYKRHYNWCLGATKGTQLRQIKGRESALVNCAAETRVIPEYLGCFIDDEQRDVEGAFERSKNMTTEACVTACRKQGFKIAATQYGEQCFCGNSYGSLGRASDAECSTPCAGNSSQRCGGGWRNSVYRVRP